MAPEHIEWNDVAPRRASDGRSYVYILPCRDDTLFKIGFSRDPLQRFRTLQRRFFEFFDLDRGALIETDRVRDARHIERQFITMFAPFGASAPLLVQRSAAGHTEWYRGVHDDAVAAAREWSFSDGYLLHAPLRPWLRERFCERSDLLFDWTRRLLEMIEFERFNPRPTVERSGCERALGEALDTCDALGLPLQALVPQAVFDWHCRSDAER